MSLGIVVDKLLILSGGATSRSEQYRLTATVPTVSPVDNRPQLPKEIADLKDELRRLGIDPDEGGWRWRWLTGRSSTRSPGGPKR